MGFGVVDLKPGEVVDIQPSICLGLRLVDKRSLPCPDRNKWLQVRDEIYGTYSMSKMASINLTGVNSAEAIMTKGWDKKRKMFVQSFEAQEDGVIDSAVLIMPLVFFIRYLGVG